MASAPLLLHAEPPAAAAEDLATRLLELVAIKSVSREEQSLCSFVETRLRAAPGVEVVRVGDNLIATLPALAGRPRVVLCGHLDTVPENGNLPPRREGDRILGLGATDLKSGLAVIWRLLDELSGLVARGPSRELDAIDCDPAFVFYAREEIAFRESGLIEVELAWPELRSAQFAVCVEPTSNAVELGCNGSNAIHSALPLLAQVAARGERCWSPPGRTDCVYREVMSVTGIAGGKARNVIPDRCTFNLNFRFAPDRGSDAARAEVSALFEKAVQAGVAELVFKDVGPAGRVPHGNRWCDRLVARAGGKVRAKQAWTDVGRFSEWNVDAVSCGPGIPEVAHQKEEWASVAMMVESLAMFRAFVGCAQVVEAAR